MVQLGPDDDLCTYLDKSIRFNTTLTEKFLDSNSVSGPMKITLDYNNTPMDDVTWKETD